MPKGTKVHKIYSKLKDRYGKASAAKIAQSVTGRSLRTGNVVSSLSARRKKRGSR